LWEIEVKPQREKKLLFTNSIGKLLNTINKLLFETTFKILEEAFFLLKTLISITKMELINSY